MSGNDYSQYRAIGARLAGFVHEHGANSLSSSQWRAAIADLVSENIDMRLPLQYICESKQFEALLKKTGPSEASLARDMLLANARRLYSEEIIGCLREILNGYLGIEEECVPQAPTASGLQTLSGSTATLQMHGKEHKKNENSQQVSNTVRRESRLAKLPLIGSLAIAMSSIGYASFLLLRSIVVPGITTLSTEDPAGKLNEKPMSCTDAIADIGRTFQDAHRAKVENVKDDPLPAYYNGMYADIPYPESRILYFFFSIETRVNSSGGRESVFLPANEHLLSSRKALQAAADALSKSCNQYSMVYFGYAGTDGGFPVFFKMKDGTMKPAVYIPCGRKGGQGKIPWGYEISC